jgi:hypothetical protein
MSISVGLLGLLSRFGLGLGVIGLAGVGLLQPFGVGLGCGMCPSGADGSV